MKTYLVGGAVRDSLLGITSSDRDYVVVGATEQQMLDLGYTRVGADFPVFLHPETHEEHALARSERKSGVGYKGFLVNTENITIEEDLARRDLTINAMARDIDTGALIDPYGGERDIQEKVLRHVSPAFEEDPLRVLRVLRFQARLGPQWAIALETRELMWRMVHRGDLDHLTRERIWKEISRGLTEPWPNLMCDGLRHFSLLARKGFEPYSAYHRWDGKLEDAMRSGRANVAVMFCLAFGRGEEEPRFSPEIPSILQQSVRRYWKLLDAPVGAITARDALGLVETTGALRPGGIDEDALQALAFTDAPLADRVRAAVSAVLKVDYKAIARQMPPGIAVGEEIANQRISSLVAAGFQPA